MRSALGLGVSFRVRVTFRVSYIWLGLVLGLGFIIRVHRCRPVYLISNGKAMREGVSWFFRTRSGGLSQVVMSWILSPLQAHGQSQMM